MKSEEKELIEVFVNFVNDYEGEDIHIPDYLKDVFFSINSDEPSEPEADGCNKQAKEFKSITDLKEGETFMAKVTIRKFNPKITIDLND